MSAAAAMRPTQLHGEPKSTLAGPAHARDGTEVPVRPWPIRRLITVTDREGVVLSSGACIGMPPAVGCPVTYLNDMGGSSRRCQPDLASASTDKERSEFQVLASPLVNIVTGHRPLARWSFNAWRAAEGPRRLAPNDGDVPQPMHQATTDRPSVAVIDIS